MAEQDKAKLNDKSGVAQIVIGVLLLIGFSILFSYMVGETDEQDEVRWARLTFLFGSAEAIAFTVVGWLFASATYRGRTLRAEADAAREREDAAASRTRAASAEAGGDALAAAVRAEAHSEEVGDVRVATASTGNLLGADAPRAVVAASLVRLRAIADAVLPERAPGVSQTLEDA